MQPSGPPPEPPAAICPNCHAQVDPSRPYCANCGFALSAPAPSTPGPETSPVPPPVDIRSAVDSDRGYLKRLQLLVPGFRGYRLGEDIREADSLLRLEVADKVHRSVAALEDCRSRMVRDNRYTSLTDLATLLSDLQKLEGEIRHAEQGYSGIAPAVRVTPDRLDRLYEYDYGFVAAADELARSVGRVVDLSAEDDARALRGALDETRARTQQLDSAFRARLETVEGIRV